MGEKTKALVGFVSLLKACLQYVNGPKGNIHPFVFLPNIWSFGEPSEMVNQKPYVGPQGEIKGKRNGSNGLQGVKGKHFDMLRHELLLSAKPKPIQTAQQNK